jgi:ubiquitin-protein ligase
MDAGRPDPKRLMRVSAEMANLPDLAVFWDSSILVRTDEGSMDLMRAYIVGPPGTPYEGGWFGFDIKLTSAYPDEPPKVSCTCGEGRWWLPDAPRRVCGRAG